MQRNKNIVASAQCSERNANYLFIHLGFILSAVTSVIHVAATFTCIPVEYVLVTG